MGDRFYCTIHRKTFTGFRIGHCGLTVRRCDDCVREARAKAQALIAKHESSKSVEHQKRSGVA